MSTESEIDAFISSLSEFDLRRILAILEYGEHKCHGATIGCCGIFRCEPCHVAHLRCCHGERAAQFWNRLCQESRLTWEPRHNDTLPVQKEAKGRKKSAKLKKVNDPSQYVPVTIEKEIRASLDRMNRIIESRSKELMND
jgi:hypothetical protein